MRILFLVIGNSRRSNFLNGDTIRTGGAGASGTDTSCILLAEYLASPEGGSHEIVISMDLLEPPLYDKYTKEGKSFPPGSTCRGVTYTNISMEGVENKTFDILINMLWFSDYQSLPIQVTKAIIIWCHLQWFYGLSDLIQYAQQHHLRCGVVHNSEWSRSFNSPHGDTLIQVIPGSQQVTIYNPLLTELLEAIPVNLNRESGKFVFSASWARGGNIAVNVVQQLTIPNKSFHAFDYLLTIHDHQDPFFHKYEGVDKSTLFQHLSNSDYFVYPLYTPYKNVHLDSFSCVVAEALISGAIVITYPIGALPEIYKDYCVWLDLPEGFNMTQEYIQTQQLVPDPEGLFKKTSHIVDKINYLEQNPEEKEKLRYKSRNDLLQRFNIQTIGSQWVNFINQLLKEGSI